MKITRTLHFAVLTLSVAAVAVAGSDGYSKFSRQKELARDGEKAEGRGDFAAAARAYRKSSLYAVDNRTRAALLLRQAECYLRASDPHDAFTAYQALLQSYPLHVPYERVLPRLRQLAGDFEHGVGNWFGFRDRTKATEVYELILQETPVGAGAIQDSLNLGSLLTATNRSAEAIPVYREALKRFPADPLAPQLRLELGRLLAEESRSGDGEGQVARQAVRELQAFADAHPADPRAGDAESLITLVAERRAEALYNLGRFYLRQAHRREPAARRYLHDAVRGFPGTIAASRAEVLLASLGPAPAVPEAPEPVTAARAPAPAGPAAEPKAISAAPAVGPSTVASAATTPAAPVPAVAPPAPAATPVPAKAKGPVRRLFEGLLPGGPADEGQPRDVRSLEERENVRKWLLPLGDVKDVRSGGGSQ